MEEENLESGLLPDLAGFSLEELLNTKNPLLVRFAAKVVQEDDESSGIVAGFQSAI